MLTQEDKQLVRRLENILYKFPDLEEAKPYIDKFFELAQEKGIKLQ